MEQSCETQQSVSIGPGGKLTSLAHREFTSADQERFAAVSGDHNPMHVDALQARRTQGGAPVVHGIHLLLWALDSYAASQPAIAPLRSFRVRFDKFVYLNERVDVVLSQQGSLGVRAKLNVSVDGIVRSKITLEFGNVLENCPIWPTTSQEQLSLSRTPLNLDFESMSGQSGQFRFTMTPEEAAGLFPSATQWLGPLRIAALAASSYLVGMVCPGLHSIYNELSVRICAQAGSQEALAFRVSETDPRFRSVNQEILGGGLMGTVNSLVRTPPVEQASMESLAGLISPIEFAGSLALIVGGSRGLGELTAKLIANGGGRVIVTWKTGREDAERVAQEIRSAGRVCETLAYDATKPVAEQLAALAATPTHAYYFATPAIFRPQAGIVVADRLKEFMAVYVDGFWQLSQELRTRQPRLSIFYPSSVSVTERPKGMTEYTMAKAAGEVLCADMNAFQAPLHVTVSRLPRLPTDQTASITAEETTDPLRVVLPIIREVQSWPQ